MTIRYQCQTLMLTGMNTCTFKKNHVRCSIYTRYFSNKNHTYKVMLYIFADSFNHRIVISICFAMVILILAVIEV
jgi:hypothetical protein